MRSRRRHFAHTRTFTLSSRLTLKNHRTSQNLQKQVRINPRKRRSSSVARTLSAPHCSTAAVGPPWRFGDPTGTHRPQNTTQRPTYPSLPPSLRLVHLSLFLSSPPLSWFYLPPAPAAPRMHESSSLPPPLFFSPPACTAREERAPGQNRCNLPAHGREERGSSSAWKINFPSSFFACTGQPRAYVSRERCTCALAAD